MTKRRERDRKPARRTSFLAPKPRLLIVCEGKVTEPQYFRGFANACQNPRVSLEVIKEVGVPLTVVTTARDQMQEAKKAAVKEKDDNLEYDSVWAVIDVDEHPNMSDAIQMARDNGVQLAISNPNFELWLLLHFREHPGAQHRDVVKKLLTGFLKDYDKHVDYKHCEAGYAEAVKRASRLGTCDLQKCLPGPNPSTGVHALTESIANSN